jgi:hypothetical protein
VPLGVLAFVDFVIGGAVWSYFRANWRYALFFVFPYFLLIAFAAAAWFAGAFTLQMSGSVAGAIAAALVAFIVLLQGPGRWCHLPLLLDTLIFVRAYMRHGHPVLDRRLELAAQEIVAAAHASQADEILVFGHSLGAALAVDLVDRTLRFDPDLGRTGTRLALVTCGSSIPKIGLHRGSVRFRAALARVAAAPNLFWSEDQAIADIANFYGTDPVALCGLKAMGRPVLRCVQISQMLDPAAYRRMTFNFYRLHCQFVSGNDRHAAYDYYMLLCGPLSAECQVHLGLGAPSAIGEDGALHEEQAWGLPERIAAQ